MQRSCIYRNLRSKLYRIAQQHIALRSNISRCEATYRAAQQHIALRSNISRGAAAYRKKTLILSACGLPRLRRDSDMSPDGSAICPFGAICPAGAICPLDTMCLRHVKKYRSCPKSIPFVSAFYFSIDFGICALYNKI